MNLHFRMAAMAAVLVFGAAALVGCKSEAQDPQEQQCPPAVAQGADTAAAPAPAAPAADTTAPADDQQQQQPPPRRARRNRHRGRGRR